MHHFACSVHIDVTSAYMEILHHVSHMLASQTCIVWQGGRERTCRFVPKGSLYIIYILWVTTWTKHFWFADVIVRAFHNSFSNSPVEILFCTFFNLVFIAVLRRSFLWHRTAHPSSVEPSIDFCASHCCVLPTPLNQLPPLATASASSSPEGTSHSPEETPFFFSRVTTQSP